MCGINGIASTQGPVDRSILEAMRDVLRHRGPDGGGLYLKDNIGLGHRRLSIVDLALGHQPMTNEDGRVVIVYNGEIYNHADWRSSLEKCGHVYRTHCDTETILHLYEEYGFDVVNKLRGMFAFAIWDVKRQMLFLARDRLGVNPSIIITRPMDRYILPQKSKLYWLQRTSLRGLTLQLCLTSLPIMRPQAR